MADFQSMFSCLRRYHGLLAAGAVLLAGHVNAQPAGGDTEDIRPAKEIIVVPKTFEEKLQEKALAVTLGSSAAAAVIVLGAFLVIWRKESSKKQASGPAKIALASLSRLESNQDSMGAEAFAYLAAKTVREYIAARFRMAAPRRTTEEFLRDVSKTEHSLIKAESDHLRAFLKSCDLAKFAGTRLDDGQRDELLQTARGFITATANPASPTKP